MINFGWRPAFFTVNLFYNYQRLTPSLWALFVYLACYVWSPAKRLLYKNLAIEKKTESAIISEKKKFKKLLRMSVCEDLLVPFYFFSFLVSSTFHFPSTAQDSLVSVLNYLYFYLDPTILTLYINTTLFLSFKFDESFSGLKVSCHFHIRKPRSI